MKLPSVAFRRYLREGPDFLSDVLDGLARRPKRIAPKYFYDERGSRLFERICEQPEYYLTRTEIGILKARSGAIARLIGAGSVVIELGSGASQKIRLLLEALRPSTYLGIDISEDFLLASTARLARDYPWLRVRAVCADLCLPLPGPALPAGPKVAFYPGSSIGNFEPAEAKSFLRRLRETLGEDGRLLIGVDLKKDPSILNAAYNDAAGVTAEFNLNLLRRMQRELGARLDRSAFDHRAFYCAERDRVEMHLVSRGRQQIRLDGRSFEFASGENIHTENSYKYDLPGFEDLARHGGFVPERVWTDEAGWFALACLRVSA